MVNPIYQLIEHQKPFVYFHTLLFDTNILSIAQSAGKSLELDISIGPDGELFIGHPLEFYTYKQLDPPLRNLPIDTIIELADLAGLYLVLDCKDVRALPWIKQIIHAYGVQRVAFHAWVDVLLFKPYPADMQIEPHWKYEDLPYDKVLELKQATGVPVICSARGLTYSLLAQNPQIADRIIAATAGRIEAVNFNLPNAEAPPTAVIHKLLENNVLTWLNVDQVPMEDLPATYIGISDHVSYASDISANACDPGPRSIYSNA